MSESIGKNKYPIGILVEFTEDGFNGDDEDDVRYKKGDKGYITAVTPTKVDRPKVMDDLSFDNSEYEYTIKTPTATLTDIPESVIHNPNTELATKVEKRLREKQANKEFKDTEGRIGGSKKEKMAYKLIRMSDLAAIEQDEATAIELVKKERVFPKIDVAAERDRGVSSGAAYLKVKLREAFGNQPPNDVLKRRVYVGQVDFIVKGFQDVYTIADFHKFRTKIREEALDEIVKSINPEVWQEVEDGNAVTQAEIESIQAEAEILQQKANYEIDKMKAAHPELVDDNLGYGINYKKVPDDEKEQRNLILDMISELGKKIQELQNSKRDIVKEFLKKVLDNGEIYGKSWATSRMYEDIFGVRYVNFLNNNNASTEKVFNDAEEYDALSQEESDEAIKSKTAYNQSLLESKEAQLAELATISSKQGYQDFFNEYTGDNTYIGGEMYKYKKKGIRFDECKTEQMVMEWKEMYIGFAEKKIKELKERIEETKKKYRVRESNWDWAFDKKAMGERKQQAEIKINSYPPLSYIKRTGGVKILDSDVSTESIREKFGFKEVEFGQSLKDTEAKEHVRHFLGAMADLADILNYNIVQLNQAGKLSIAFASRGGGRFAAHYESLRKVINVTKTRGGGAIAHEYMHYLDNIIPSINRGEYSHTDWASSPNENSWGQKKYKIQNDIVKNALDDIFTYIYYRKVNGTQSESDAVIKKTIQANTQTYSIPKGFNDYVDGVYRYYEPENIESYVEAFFKKFSTYRYIEHLKKKEFDILGYIVHKFGFKSYEFSFKTRQSAYYANSTAMSSDYWSRSWELLARAFETYIYDKLDKAGRANNYLVSGAYFDREEGVYPYGEEREQLFILFDVLMQAIKTEYNIGDFVAWTDERVDEYIVLDEKKDEEVTESGVIVDAESGEAIAEVGEEQPEKPSGNAATAKEKLRELAFLLKNEPKLEDGGEINSNSDLTNRLYNFLVGLQN